MEVILFFVYYYYVNYTNLLRQWEREVFGKN